MQLAELEGLFGNSKLEVVEGKRVGSSGWKSILTEQDLCCNSAFDSVDRFGSGVGRLVVGKLMD